LEATIHNYETFRKTIGRFISRKNQAIFRPPIDFFQSSFAGFLGSMQINNPQEKKKANFLTAEGVLTVVNKNENIYKMSSAFMDELMRRQVISEIYKSCPECAVPQKI
jgi:hypothetical protein